MISQSRCRRNKFLAILLALAATLPVQGGGINSDPVRAEEIRKEMWMSKDPAFTVVDVPEKWKNEDAVLLMRDLSYSYHKVALSTRLRYFQRVHIRVKIQTARALERYSQFSLRGSYTSYPVTLNTFAGFRIVKPSGTFNEVPLVLAVKETESLNKRSYDTYKLALPNLELGDILDYYIVREESIDLGSGKYYPFDPVVLPLNSEFPTVKMRLSFDVLRRCYINLKSLNGAPPLALSEAEEDQNRYYIEVNDLRGIPEFEFIYPFRQLPSVKFKVVYASAQVASYIKAFIGDVGEVKSSVSEDEIRGFMKSAFTFYGTSDVKPYMKKNFKDLKDPNALAKHAYYAFRNQYGVEGAEADLLADRDNDPNFSSRAVVALSKYYRANKIPHEVMIGIPRSISSINDLLLEDEISLAMKVYTKPPMIVGKMTMHSLVNELDEDLQGTDVLVANGMLEPSVWAFSRQKLPIDNPEANTTDVQVTASLTDLGEGIADAAYQVSSSGTMKTDFQNQFMDFYDYKDEEMKRYPFKSLSNLSTSQTAKAAKLKQDYLATKPAKLEEKTKKYIEENFDFIIDHVEKLVIVQTGRFDEAPNFIFKHNVRVKELTRSVGPNILFSIGKLVEKQSTIPQAPVLRDYDVYLPSPQVLSYTISVAIPAGYTPKGLEALNYSLNNKAGIVEMKSEQKGSTLVFNFRTTYKSNFVPKRDWPDLDAFMQACQLVNGKQVLFEKN